MHMKHSLFGLAVSVIFLCGPHVARSPQTNYAKLARQSRGQRRYRFAMVK